MQTLDAAGERYRNVISEFNQHAKAEVIEHLQRRAAEITTATLGSINVAMPAAASAAFRSEASDKAVALGVALGDVAQEFRASRTTRLVEAALLCLLSSAITAALVVSMIR